VIRLSGERGEERSARGPGPARRIVQQAVDPPLAAGRGRLHLAVAVGLRVTVHQIESLNLQQYVLVSGFARCRGRS